MAVKLNLLPQDYAVSDSVNNVLKIARPTNVILLCLFLVISLSVAGFFIFESINIKKINTTNTLLRSQIASQEKAQQQAVLLKDRIGKIQQVFAKPEAYKNLNAINPVLLGVSEDASVSDLEVGPEGANVEINFKTNSSLLSFLDSLKSQVSFSTVSIEKFNYDSESGYSVGFLFAAKN